MVIGRERSLPQTTHVSRPISAGSQVLAFVFQSVPESLCNLRQDNSKTSFQMNVHGRSCSLASSFDRNRNNKSKERLVTAQMCSESLPSREQGESLSTSQLCFLPLGFSSKPFRVTSECRQTSFSHMFLAVCDELMRGLNLSPWLETWMFDSSLKSTDIKQNDSPFWISSLITLLDDLFGRSEESTIPSSPPVNMPQRTPLRPSPWCEHRSLACFPVGLGDSSFSGLFWGNVIIPPDSTKGPKL